MKKIFFTLVLSLSLFAVKAASNVDTTVIFDAATSDTIGVGAQGFAMVTVNGAPCLKIIVNSWNTNVMLNHHVKLAAGNLYTFNVLAAVTKVAINPSDTFVHVGRNVFFQPFDSATGTSFNVAGTAPTVFTKMTGGSASTAFDIVKVQVAVQGRGGSWPAQVGDTVYLKKLVSYQTQLPQTAATVFDTIQKVDDFDITDPNNDPIWTDNSKPKSVNNLATGSASGAATGTFQAMWNPDYLYLNFKVTDSNPVSFTGSNPWNNDGIESFIDPNGLHFIGQRIGFQRQVRYNWGLIDSISGSYNALLRNYGNDSISQGTVLMKQVSISGGYRIIVKIPWYTLWISAQGDTLVKNLDNYVTAASTTIKEGAEVSFECSILNNNTTPEVRTSIMNWANKTGHDTAYLSSGTWGSLILAGPVTGVKTISSNASFKMSPNPVVDVLTVNDKDLISVELFSLDGKLIKKQISNSNQVQINMSGLTKGLYILKANSKGGITTGKVIKE